MKGKDLPAIRNIVCRGL